MTRIVLHIDRVIVEGTELTPRDAETLRRGLEAELGVKLRRKMDGAAGRGGVVPATLGTHPAPAISAAGGARATGKAAAVSLAGALRPLLTARPARVPSGGGTDEGTGHG
jgi:hypothetical protein